MQANKLIRVLRLVTADEKSDVWYHGRTTKSETFDINRTGKGNDQEGPGFYFSSDYKDAASYAYPSGVVMTVDIDLGGRITPEEFEESDFETFLEMADPEDLEITLSNYAEHPEEAKATLKEAIINDDNPYLTVWYEMFRHNPAGYLKAMVDLGYDGHVSTPNEHIDTKHLIVYNPDVIDIQEVDDYVKE